MKYVWVEQRYCIFVFIYKYLRDMDGLTMRFVFDRKGETKKNPNKEALLQIEVYDKVSRRKIYISTDIYLLAKQFFSRRGFSVKSHANALIIKSKGHRIYNKIYDYIHSDKCNKLEDVRNWNNSINNNQNIIDFIEQQHRVEAPDDTHSDYTSFLTRLKEYGKIQYFRYLTYDNIEEFDVH